MGVGERVQERRLAGVRVADQADRRDGASVTRLALRRPRLGDALQVLLELRDSPLDPPTVDLQLGLTWSSGADATALLAQRDAPPTQAGEAVAELRELDLQHPGLARGVLGEDVHDQRDSVDDVASESLLEVALLRGAELVVEDDDVDVERLGGRAELLGLARSDVGRGVR